MNSKSNPNALLLFNDQRTNREIVIVAYSQYIANFKLYVLFALIINTYEI